VSEANITLSSLRYLRARLAFHIENDHVNSKKLEKLRSGLSFELQDRETIHQRIEGKEWFSAAKALLHQLTEDEKRAKAWTIK
jgi:hypothetical protein